MKKIQMYLNFLAEVSNKDWRVVFGNGRDIVIERKDHNLWAEVEQTKKETLLRDLALIISEQIGVT